MNMANQSPTRNQEAFDDDDERDSAYGDEVES
jgi:hypothetical protein